MKGFLYNKKNTAAFRAIKIILINVVLLAVLLLLFMPTEKVDDYRMKFILAGAATGQSDNHLLYSNMILGQILKGLTNLAPLISWYEVTQYIVLFISFCVLVYLIQKRKLGMAGNAIILILLAIFGFDAYIRLTFSKTAGIACAAGLFLLFSVLYDLNIKKAGFGKILIRLIVAAFLIIMGALFRMNMFRLIFGIGMAYLGYRFLCGCIDIKKKESQLNLKNLLLRVVRTVAVCLAFFFLLSALNREGSSLFRQDAGWLAYARWNPLKSKLQDYGWPDYDENQEAYEELGIDEVMYNFWKNKDYADPEYFTTDVMQSIIQIKSSGSSSQNRASQITSFFKQFPLRFLREICFWAVLALIIYWCISKQRYKKLMLIVSFSLLILLNLYQYLDGRYDQHHINVGIWFAVALIFISCMTEAKVDVNFKQSRLALPLAGLFLLCFSFSNYNYLTDASYYGTMYNGDDFSRKVSLDSTKKFLTLVSEDKEHLYITGFEELNLGFVGCSTFEQIPSGLYHNIFCVQEYMYPTSRVSLDNYGVYNVYREMVDSDVIYYYKSDDTSEAELERMEAYIQDLYNDTAQSCLMKRFGGLSVYGFFSDDFQLNTDNLMDVSSGEEDVFSNVTLSITIEAADEEESAQVTTELNGNIYKSGSNSFNQRVYLEICSDNGEASYQAVTMYENDETNDIMNGAYGKVFETFSTELSEWDQNATYNIILECDEGMYRLPLEANIVY